MALNFNVEPYYDDFDPSKNFHRILFKPGYAVQARELTQSQTIIQDQISKFANHIFTQNTPVSGGKVTSNFNCYYIKLNRQYNNKNIAAADFLNKIISDDSGAITAKVIATAEATGTDVAAGDPPTLIVSYLSGDRFTDNMHVYPVDGSSLNATTIGVPGESTCTGKSSTASIAEGVFYVVNGYSQSSTQNSDGTYTKYSVGNFVSVLPQTIILNKYSNVPSYRVGLFITETVVDAIGDKTLLDPAVGASNYQAPGADRYYIELQLTALPLDIGNDDQFIELVRIEDGAVSKQVDGSVYSSIDDYFAKRTYETSGDYIVQDFKLTPSANTINGDKYILTVGPGKAYVQGYRVENQSTVRLDSDRSRTTETVQNNTSFVDYGSYFLVDTVKGANGSFFGPTTSTPVDFHTVRVENLKTSNTTVYNSTLAGTGYIRNLVYTSSTSDSNTRTWVYKAYVYDVSNKVLSGSIASANATHISFTDTNGKFSSVANAYLGVTVTIDSGLDVGDTRKIVDYNGSTKTAKVDVPFALTPSAADTFSLRFGNKDVEALTYFSNSAFTIYGSAAINNVGKTDQLITGDTVLFNQTTPELILPLGIPFANTISDSSYTTTQEFRGQTFGLYSTGSQRTLSLDISATGSFDFIRTGSTETVDALKQNWVIVVTDKGINSGINVGDVLSFSVANRSIAVDPNKNSVVLTALDLSPFTATIYTKVSVTNGNDTNYVLKTKTLVTANTNYVNYTGPDGIINFGNYLDLNNGQLYVTQSYVAQYGSKQSLYVSDVRRIIKIIDCKGSLPTNDMLVNNSYDVTDRYEFNNGQTDSYYGHSYITLKPGYAKPTNILILFDFYSHSGGDGYFSAQSYTGSTFTDRPTYKSKKGTTYSLKDCLDFRPVVLNAQTAFTFKYRTTPTTTNFSGALIPVDLSTFTCDYTYYLGRKDILVIDKDKSIKLVTGQPSAKPVAPVTPSSALLLANITLDPYTAYLPGEAVGQPSNIFIQPVLHKRWAFSDITDLQTRVNNLEYYTSLSLIEQNAASLQIPDNNGLNRFKNGIMVDDFSTYAVGDTTNKDFSAALNTRLQYLTPALLVKNYSLKNLNLLSAKNLSQTTLNNLTYYPKFTGSSALYTLPYTEVQLVAQPLASRVLNANPFSVIKSTGNITLTPPMDNWVDNTAEPDLLFVDPNLKVYNPSSTLNLLEGNPTLSVGDWKTIPGTQKDTAVVDGRTTTTTTTVTKENQYTYGYWSQSYNQVGNYLTNVSILPYIRGQYIMFQADGMLFKTAVNAFFDGKRVSRLIRKPNIIELTNVSGTGKFTRGDTIGYVSSSVFRYAGYVSDVYTYSNGNVRLYVIGDLDTTNYTSTGTVVNSFFNTSGVYQTSTAQGTLASQTHWSGKIATNGTTTANVTLSALASSTDIYTGQEFKIVTGSATGVASIPKGYKATVTSYNTNTKTVTLDRSITYLAGDGYSIGALVTNEVGSISGVFTLPGGYFHSGERVFRLDDRIINQTENEFRYSTGTENTFAEASFYAQGLSTRSQQIDYSASVSTAKNTQTTIQTQAGFVTNVSSVTAAGGGGGCCVIATALTDKGLWQQEQKDTLIAWCEKYLHNKMLGECFRRGYQVIGSKLLVPALRSKWFSAYANWAWTNGTNMVMGKKFNPLSIPNSVAWIAVWMTVGALVTTKFAKKCWTSLYK
jgi:hypothetical protein